MLCVRSLYFIRYLCCYSDDYHKITRIVIKCTVFSYAITKLQCTLHRQNVSASDEFRYAILLLRLHHYLYHICVTTPCCGNRKHCHYVTLYVISL